MREEGERRWEEWRLDQMEEHKRVQCSSRQLTVLGFLSIERALVGHPLQLLPDKGHVCPS